MLNIRSGGANHVPISNPGKILYPGGKFTKANVVDYYTRVAPYLLPHIRNRPVTLKRYPDGVYGEAFYEKDAPGFTPKWVKTFPVPRHEGGPDINYILINDRRTLTWTASIAALELHPFLHCVPHIHRPTHIVFDLDPGEGMNVLNCAEISFLLRDVLRKLRLKSFPKVSGSKGIQVYVPLNTRITYDQTQSFARATAELMEKTHPGKVVADMAKNLRVGRIFIDWSQNADFKTTVGVYSLRAKRPRPYVSMPVKWEELAKALQKSNAALLDFEPDEALHRLKRIGDLFAPLRNLKQKLPKAFTAEPVKKPRTTRPLVDYDAKRDFTRTTEPSPQIPRRSAQGSRRRFVVQKHAASHLHYDLRLEIHDVLKSWAVPKGIPLRENETHTAFQTEDHPIEYLQFEGVIPRGEYGGGTVMVWDLGTFEVIDGNYWKGRLSVFLAGKKLKGEWRLERIGDENGKTKWSLRKTATNAKPISARRKELSALSGRTMEQIAGTKSGGFPAADDGASESTAGVENAPARTARAKLKRTPVPHFIAPMKATAVTELPKGDEWIYEVKWDGYRALGLKHGDDVRLLSLKEKDLTSDFPAVADALDSLSAGTALIDGEIVAVDSKGCPSFQALQNRASMGRDWQIVYYAFDLLNVEGEDWTKKPLELRKQKLREITKGSDVRYNANLSGSPEAIIRTIETAGLEGVIAKKRDSVYRAGTRVTSWLKFKINKAQEFVIGGYKPDTESFQSILVGYYETKKLIFAGKVRQGFNPASRAKLYHAMQRFLTGKCPFDNLPSSRKNHFGEGITADEMKKLCWLRPKLVAQISFTEWTNYGLLRHATFEGLRDDKEARQVVRELNAQ
ncbi:MAG TPA: non-homologous end-joining DNA ligase [Candidatus Udaeobacter sp.]|nr:non-homologous end-joining DNA ligase [Candidatus Udaeobacter sp.]